MKSGAESDQAAFDELFLYCSSKIDPEVIARCCPGDPGYKGYVKEWNRIWRDRIIPRRSNFEISETVGLTMWDEGLDAEMFRFRCFTNAVALKLMCVHLQEPVFDLNYPLIRLLTDTILLSDKNAFMKLRAAVESARRVCSAGAIELADALPWICHAQLLLASFQEGASQLRMLARRVIEEENTFRKEAEGGLISGVFLFGLTVFQTCHPLWLNLSTSLLTPHRTVEEIALILDGLSEYHRDKDTVGGSQVFGEEHLRVFRLT